MQVTKWPSTQWHPHLGSCVSLCLKGLEDGQEQRQRYDEQAKDGRQSKVSGQMMEVQRREKKLVMRRGSALFGHVRLGSDRSGYVG